MDGGAVVHEGAVGGNVNPHIFKYSRRRRVAVVIEDLVAQATAPIRRAGPTGTGLGEGGGGGERKTHVCGVTAPTHRTVWCPHQDRSRDRVYSPSLSNATRRSGISPVPCGSVALGAKLESRLGVGITRKSIRE